MNYHVDIYIYTQKICVGYFSFNKSAVFFFGNSESCDVMRFVDILMSKFTRDIAQLSLMQIRAILRNEKFDNYNLM